MKKFKKMLVYDFTGSTFLAEQLKPFCEEMIIKTAEKDFSDEMTSDNLKRADAFVAKPFGNYDKSFLEKADKLKYFGLVSTSYAVVDTAFLKSKRIAFTNVPHYSTESVAELCFSALLEIARHTSQATINAKTNYTTKRHLGFELKRKTLGIIGLGDIGTRVAEIAKTFGMTLLYYSKTRKPKLEKKLGIKFLKLEELLKTSDIVSLHCSLNEQTKGILSKERLSLLKDGAILLNSARAELCDLDAVAELASAGKIFCWFEALDEEEQRKKLINLENVIVTPHIGWMTIEAQKRLDEIAVENVKAVLNGKPQNRIV